MKPDSTDKPPTGSAAEFAEASRDEFPDGASEFTDEVSRRRFLAIAGASAALAGAAGCIRPAPARKIVPYAVQPDEVTPGVPILFATAFPLCGYGTGILVRSNEGRPTKIEPNPDHPSSAGGAGVYAQGSLLDLYDPDRSKAPTRRGLPVAYDQVVAALNSALYDTSVNPPLPKAGVRLRILSETVTSPTLTSLVTRLFDKFPNARWAQYDAVGGEGAHKGARKAFGRPLSVVYDFAKADVVLSLDSDFITRLPGSERYSRDFTDRRKIRKDGKNADEIAKGSKKEGVKADELNRLYVVESMPTCTGSVADHRLAVPSTLVETFARLLAAELGVKGPAAGATPAETAQRWTPWIKALADDLRAKKGKSIVVAGEHQSASLHALTHAINANLENLGKTVLLTGPFEARPEGKVIDLKTLADEIGRKDVDVLLILGVNIAYTAPADLPFANLIRRDNVPFSLHLGSHVDETAVLCEWHVNEAHYLETWGDIRGHDGTVTIQQPLIAPLYKGRSAIEFLAAIAPALPAPKEEPKDKKEPAPAPLQPRDGLDILRVFWRSQFTAENRPGEFEVFWQESVRAGVVAGTAMPREEKIGLQGNWSADAPNIPVSVELELNFRLDPTIHDGRYANNGWLQECPKPITKMTWDNAAYMSAATASKIDGLPEAYPRWTGGEHGRMEVGVVELKIKVGGEERVVKAPAWVIPGHADNSITVHLGYGRKRAGRVNTTPDEPNAAGEDVRGFNANALRNWVAAAGAAGFAATTVVTTRDSVTNTNSKYFLACVQAFASMVQRDPLSGHIWDRQPVRWGTLTKQPEDSARYKGIPVYKDEPAFAKMPPVAPAEWREINENVPGPAHHHPDPKSGVQEKHGSGNGHGQSHALTMYHPNDALAPDLPEGQKRRWAMAIDLNACTGCSACVVACVSENNIPVVGKYEVTRGRAMHWINVDRYYKGPQDDPDPNITLFQPRMCVQCEKAPCEVVCPVGATVHSTDGLNDMAYNRCVGTRYCSNNCPYKVRRFNFLSFQDWDTATLKLGRNPDVSVRSRGVMEKCTFCVQRIRGAEIVAEREHRHIKDGEIVTACQSACPSDAIVFGDLQDSHSTVATWKNEPRNYGFLAELNTMPRLTHLAVVRNPNPALVNALNAVKGA